MKSLINVLIVVFLVASFIFFLFGLGSCNPVYKCYPSPGSKDFARVWITQKSDGYFLVTVIRNLGRKDYLFECYPDSAQLAAL